MKKQIVIAGSGFAGMWAALSAARAITLAGRNDDVGVTVVSPAPTLVIRPRLYEATIEGMDPDLLQLFDATGILHVKGRITSIDPEAHRLEVVDERGVPTSLEYDKFVLATGSRLFQPPVPGLSEHGFNVDQLEDAKKLQAHLDSLASKPASKARNTVVIAGGGFTGIETAAEMPKRLRGILAGDIDTRVVIVEQAPDIGPELGPVPRPVIQEALSECGVEIVTGTSVIAITPHGVTTSDGTHIDTHTVVWTAGARAHPLAGQIPGKRDQYGRVHGDAYLRAPDAADIFVTGDVVNAATDDQGNVAAMSCQHAMSLGRVAGHNAAAELLDLPLHPYSQPKYVTCLDIGAWGALYTEGWDRQIHLTRNEGKLLKQEITTKWIYPPAPDRDAVFAVANPDFVIVP
jgi:NADH dehydrogenase